MFEGIDTAALLIWLVNPYISLAGNLEVSTYTSLTNSTASFHTLKSRYDLDFSALNLISPHIHTENGKRKTIFYDLDFSALNLIPPPTENGKRKTENYFLGLKSSPTRIFSVWDRSPMNLRSGGGNCLMRVGVAIICSPRARTGCW